MDKFESLAPLHNKLYNRGAKLSKFSITSVTSKYICDFDVDKIAALSRDIICGFFEKIIMSRLCVHGVYGLPNTMLLNSHLNKQKQLILLSILL